MPVCPGRSGLVWLACGPQLEVAHAMTGERLSAYCFSGGTEHPPSVLAARDFSWLKRSEFCFWFPSRCLTEIILSQNKRIIISFHIWEAGLLQGCLRHLFVTENILIFYQFNLDNWENICEIEVCCFFVPRSGLLVGLEEAEGSVLCLYDLGLSRVVKAVVIPGRVSWQFRWSLFVFFFSLLSLHIEHLQLLQSALTWSF